VFGEPYPGLSARQQRHTAALRPLRVRPAHHRVPSCTCRTPVSWCETPPFRRCRPKLAVRTSFRIAGTYGGVVALCVFCFVVEVSFHAALRRFLSSLRC
jgi:hypothetical protein